jgi:hypothetical protein
MMVMAASVAVLCSPDRRLGDDFLINKPKPVTVPNIKKRLSSTEAPEPC